MYVHQEKEMELPLVLVLVLVLEFELKLCGSWQISVHVPRNFCHFGTTNTSNQQAPAT